MKSYLALTLLIASLAACARETPAPSAPAAPSSSSAAASTPAPARAAPAAASGSAASVTDVAAAASTQQEGADTGTAADSGEAALERVAALPPEGQLPSIGKWIAGTNYQIITPAQPTDVAAGKVEVIEAFWYHCPHCYALDPSIESWRKNKANYIDFRRVPVTWGESHRSDARLFYTLQALGKLDALHTKVFDEIHAKNDPLFVAGDDNGTKRMMLAFAKANGISESDFMNAYNSFGVQANVQKADELTRRYKVESVPNIIINGKYITDVAQAGGEDNLIRLINDLTASEKRH